MGAEAEVKREKLRGICQHQQSVSRSDSLMDNGTAGRFYRQQNSEYFWNDSVEGPATGGIPRLV